MKNIISLLLFLGINTPHAFTNQDVIISLHNLIGQAQQLRSQLSRKLNAHESFTINDSLNVVNVINRLPDLTRESQQFLTPIAYSTFQEQAQLLCYYQFNSIDSRLAQDTHTGVQLALDYTREAHGLAVALINRIQAYVSGQH